MNLFLLALWKIKITTHLPLVQNINRFLYDRALNVQGVVSQLVSCHRGVFSAAAFCEARPCGEVEYVTQN